MSYGGNTGGGAGGVRLIRKEVNRQPAVFTTTAEATVYF